MGVRIWRTYLAVALMVFPLAGCITGPDWDARIGQYTYAQALKDLGPPDKLAKLSDGGIAAEWLTQRAHTVTAPEPYFLPPGAYFGPPTPGLTRTDVPDHYLRLVFGPAGKLKAWKKLVQ